MRVFCTDSTMDGAPYLYLFICLFHLSFPLTGSDTALHSKGHWVLPEVISDASHRIFVVWKLLQHQIIDELDQVGEFKRWGCFYQQVLIDCIDGQTLQCRWQLWKSHLKRWSPESGASFVASCLENFGVDQSEQKAAGLVLTEWGGKKPDGVSPALVSPHQLPVPDRILFKSLVLLFFLFKS